LSARSLTEGAPLAEEVREERVLLSRAFARLDPVALSLAVGVVTGLALAAATAVLLLQGGSRVGLHLSRVGMFLPGYDVSWSGAVVGFFEGGALGCVVGLAVALLWNGYHRMFVALVVARERRRDLRRELSGL
jgi:hypothetical protein